MKRNTLIHYGKTALEKISIPIGAFVLSLFVCSIFIALSGFNPLQIYYQVFASVFRTPKNIASALAQATPLMFSGMAYAIASKIGLINLGLEGQMLLGAMASALAGAYITGVPIWIHLPLSLLIGAFAGAIASGISGVLKIRFGAREVITTIMLNEIIALFVAYLCNGPLRDPGSNWGMTKEILPTATLPKMMDGTQLTYAICIAIAIGIVLEIVLKKTVLGYKMQCTGFNLRAAETAGIQTGRLYFGGICLSGAIAGLCGAAMVLGVNLKFIDGFSDNYGWSGISVAALAAFDPLMSCVSAFLFGILKAGAMNLNRTTSVPTEFVSVIQAVVVVFVSAPKITQMVFNVKGIKRLYLKHSKKDASRE